jgi:hypothetical protein
MQSRQAVFVPKRHVPSGERLEPVVPGHGRPVKVNPPPWQRPNRQRGSEAARKASAPAALQRPHGIHPLQRKSNIRLLPSAKKYPPPSFPLFGSPWRQAAAAAVARAPAPRESPSLSIFQSTAATKGKRPHRWREVGRYLVARLSHTDLVGFESSRRTQVRAARRRRRCTRARGSSPASCTRASSPTSGQ